MTGTPELVKGLVAHIVAERPTGPRGDPVRSPQLVDDVANVMLLCHDDHRVIDVERPADYPEERLLAIKHAHENRISIQTSIAPDRATHVLRYGALIGQNEPLLPQTEMFEALLPARYPATLSSIDIKLAGCQYADHEPEYWTFQQENLRRQLTTQLKGRIETGEIRHLSVFGLAPQALLIELGRQIGDIVPAEIFQRHREPATWAWPSSGVPIPFTVTPPTHIRSVVALKIALSATVHDERITAVLGDDVSIWSVTVPEPHNDILKVTSDLARFRQLMRGLFNEIKATHGERAVINLFPAMPVSTAVEVGRVWMPKADLPLVIFDQNRSRGQFIHALDIRPPEVP